MQGNPIDSWPRRLRSSGWGCWLPSLRSKVLGKETPPTPNPASLRPPACGNREDPLLPSGAPGHPAHTASAHGLVSPSLSEHKGPVTADAHPNRRGRHAPRGAQTCRVPSAALGRVLLLWHWQASAQEATLGPEGPGGQGGRGTTCPGLPLAV